MTGNDEEIKDKCNLDEYKFEAKKYIKDRIEEQTELTNEDYTIFLSILNTY